MKIKKVLSRLLTISLLLTACDNPTVIAPPANSASLVILLEQNVSRTILPDITMEITEYTIRGTGPNGVSFTKTTTENTFAIDELAFGDWEINVCGKNTEGFPIGTGNASATVHTGETTTVSIVVSPFEGFGNLELTVNWTAGDLEIPSVKANLTRATGNPVTLDFTLLENSAVFSSETIAAGYYTLTVELLDNNINTMGIVEVVRIVKDATTEGFFDFYEVNIPGGTIGVYIVQEMNDPIEVEITGLPDSFHNSSTVTVGASAPAETENLVYIWYINGRSYAMGPYCVLNGIDKGIYNLNVVAFTVDGSRAGSAKSTFGVTEMDFSSYTQIHDIQGQAHTSPLVGTSQTDIIGIVTAKDNKGFWMQSPAPDNNRATSEGILVYTNSIPAVNVGDLVVVDGTVKEYGYTNELKLTEITYPTITAILQSDYPAPDPVILGNGGRILPNTVICNDSAGDFYNSPFDPEEDGIDFYESIENMLVQVNDALVVGGDKYGEIPVLADRGANAPAYTKTERGGVSIRETNYNPNLIIVDSDSYILGQSALEVKTGDRFDDPIIGVIGYSFGKFIVMPTVLPELVVSTLPREGSSITGNEDHLTVASFNLENFPRDDKHMSTNEIQEKIQEIAETIVDGLNSPDIIAIEEITDDSYSADDGVLTASANYKALISAITTAGGPSSYDFREIIPVNNEEGGWKGANIRVGFLFNSARVVFEDIGNGDSVTDTQVVNNGGNADISLSPGRIDVSSFEGSRKPLIGKFTFKNESVFIIANHFNSKGGDSALFGEIQPPFLGSEAERMIQATAINTFVDELLAIQSDAKIVVAGDLNDFQFSAPLETLKGDVLFNLTEELLPSAEQYSYIYNGNSQQLDHILVSSGLFNASPKVDIVHRYSEYSSQTRKTDHDPLLSSFLFSGTNPPAGITRLFFSDYGEGSSNNKYLEVFNGGTFYRVHP